MGLLQVKYSAEALLSSAQVTPLRISPFRGFRPEVERGDQTCSFFCVYFCCGIFCYGCMFAFVVLDLQCSFSVLSQEIGCEERPRDDLLCRVGRKTLTQSINTAAVMSVAGV